MTLPIPPKMDPKTEKNAKGIHWRRRTIDLDPVWPEMVWRRRTIDLDPVWPETVP